MPQYELLNALKIDLYHLEIFLRTDSRLEKQIFFANLGNLGTLKTRPDLLKENLSGGGGKITEISSFLDSFKSQYSKS